MTNDLKRRLKEYNSLTGQSQENAYSYLFSCEVANMRAIEQDLKNAFTHLREVQTREIYFYNPALFENYLSFIKSHPDFIAQIHTKPLKDKAQKKPLATPSLQERGVIRKTTL
nr:GIY-YIG nuclease family protein [Helicobacter sp. NHP21005]